MVHLACKNIQQHTKYGRKYFCYCSVHVYVDSEKWTDDIEKVTCKKCKSELNKILKSKVYQNG
jgi:hypothetical protein